MDLEKYWGLVNNWTPENEEQRQDQVRYIRAMMEARELYRKEVMSDEEYERNINLTVDEEQRQQFVNDHISQSAYDEQMDAIAEITAEIDTKYGFGQDKIGQEFTTEVLRKRGELTALQAYFRSVNDGLPSNVMFNANVDTMTANEIIDYYERVHAALERQDEGRSFEDLVELGREAIKEEHRQRIRDRLNLRKTAKKGNKTGKESIEEKINNFKNDADDMKAEIDKVKAELVLGTENKGFELTDAVKGLETELGELAAEAEQLKAEIDAFVLETGAPDFSMTPAEIENRVKKLKSDLKNLKQNLVSKYDARVDMTNAKIAELKAMTDLSPEVEALINGLTELQKCGVTVKNWKHNSFLSVIDFNKLVEVNKVIADIESKLGVKRGPSDDTDLEADMVYIENEIDRIETEIVPDLSVDDVNRLKQDLQVVADNVNNFRLKLEANKDKITEEEYNNYIVRIEDAEANLAHLYGKLKALDKGKDGKNKDYEELLEAVNKLSTEIDRLADDVVAFHGLVVEGGVHVFESRLSIAEKDLETLKNDIETRHKDGKIDVNQYNSLMDKVKDMEQKLVDTKTKLKDPGMIKDADIFAILNGQIDGLEAAVTKLEEQIEKLPKPIKDKETRKNIDKIIKGLEKEVKDLEETLEKYKDEDPQKYEATKERLNKVKDRLEKVGKNYRKKCPLMIRAYKEAKHFFKKHAKTCLIIAGLAAFALVAHQVLIPAIMHGLAMVEYTSPFMAPFAEFSGKILGGMIGATRDINGAYFLANGVHINASVAASSLLKGLAISGIGTTALVAPLVVAIKKLIDKMKTADLKKKFAEGKEKLREKMPAKKEKKEKTEKKPSTKKADKMSVEELAKLLKEYRKSGKTLDEFCAEKELSEEEKTILQYLDSRSRENMEEMKNSGRKGR